MIYITYNNNNDITGIYGVKVLSSTDNIAKVENLPKKSKADKDKNYFIESIENGYATLVLR